MPLYEISKQNELVPLRRVGGSGDGFEEEIESLLWDNLEELTGEPLLRVARHPDVEGGFAPDIVALDHSGRVVVIAVKRDVDRGELAQVLGHAGWARGSGLDELAGIYCGGGDSFLRDWQDFSTSAAPLVVNPSPRVIVVARTFHDRAESALSYLIEHGVPVQLLAVGLYEDPSGRRLLDLKAERRPLVAAAGGDAGLRSAEHAKAPARAARVLDLLEAELLQVGDKLHWDRPRGGKRSAAVITDNGSIRVADGREFSSPSRAAMVVADIASYDGWYAWKVDRLGGVTLNDVRLQLATGGEQPVDLSVAAARQPDAPSAPPEEPARAPLKITSAGLQMDQPGPAPA